MYYTMKNKLIIILLFIITSLILAINNDMTNQCIASGGERDVCIGVRG